MKEAGEPSGRKLLRFDKAYEAAAQADRQAEAESPGLLEWLRQAIGASRDDRRGLVRHPVSDDQIWVGWWVDDAFGAVPGRLVNLSRSGAMLVVAPRPPRKQPIWLYKEVDNTLACVRGDLVGLTPAPDGAYRIRIRFAAPCPTILCQAAVCGPPDRPRSARRGDQGPAPAAGS